MNCEACGHPVQKHWGESGACFECSLHFINGHENWQTVCFPWEFR